MKKERALLRVLRASHEPKITQIQIARLAGMTNARYWLIEHGEGAEPSPKERQAIANVLGVKVSDIAWPEFPKAQAS